MKNPFKIGDQKRYTKLVSTDDTAVFEAGQVHPVYATFALARDAEWGGRLFVLEMKEEDEVGIGTFVHVDHVSPALVDSQVEIISTVKSIEGNEIITDFEAKVGNRLIASGSQGQKILKKEKIDKLFNKLQ